MIIYKKLSCGADAEPKVPLKRLWRLAIKRIRGFSLAKTAGFFHKNGFSEHLLVMQQREQLSFLYHLFEFPFAIIINNSGFHTLHWVPYYANGNVRFEIILFFSIFRDYTRLDFHCHVEFPVV